MPSLFSWTAIGTLLHLSVVGGLTLRILSKRRASGVAMAWMILLFTFPVAGVIMYMFVGETWLCGRRSKRTAQAAEKLREPIKELDEIFGTQEAFAHPAARAIVELGRSGMCPPFLGNHAEMFSNADTSFARLIHDIDHAKRSCDLLYYIWLPGGRVSHVEEALIRACKRGVHCRVMVDAVGGSALFKSRSAENLHQAGVQLRESLPVNFLRASLHRVDIRNHRKLAVVDDRIAYVGSMNMADPVLFKSNEGYGRWVDMTARVEGPSASLLGDIFEVDWAMESRGDIRTELDVDLVRTPGETVTQVVPSGPGQMPELLSRVLTAAVYGAQQKLTLTTPYFIPDDAFVSGLQSAALRGVEVTVIVPERVNGIFVRLASNAFYDGLLDVGVRVLRYKEGLLHAKTMTVDDAVGIVGTVNIDRRSFWLNYELSFVLHGPRAVKDLYAIQEGYMAKSEPLRDSAWMRRGRAQRLAEQAAHLFAPIL